MHMRVTGAPKRIFLATNKKRDFEFRKRKGDEDLGREDRFEF